MSETQVSYPPPWLGQTQPVQPQLPPPPAVPRKPGNPAWTPGMRSPNQAGRPKGIVDKRSKLSQRMLADAEGIVSALIDKALEGDTGAASLILSRVLPSLRSQAEKVAFDFDATAPVVRQVEQVLAAIAGGVVAPDVGKQIIEAIGALSAIRATEELEARLAALEAKQ
ncbi:DUF5681 domain-containing protein [Sphingomonas sp. M1-B02]|uniref:DUF5681 domain-containing protein n=1 Tax=Sphingomonas sp. M1-B02 TaxID=3114300 RepID=UPI00223F12CC|nr:hypothetical protein [Sphingomonas sp. S6-11]UZK65866.1 hypothetical protein OKW87_15350 [Sphingomonas sp. S6-11]